MLHDMSELQNCYGKCKVNLAHGKLKKTALRNGQISVFMTILVLKRRKAE